MARRSLEAEGVVPQPWKANLIVALPAVPFRVAPESGTTTSQSRFVTVRDCAKLTDAWHNEGSDQAWHLMAEQRTAVPLRSPGGSRGEPWMLPPPALLRPGTEPGEQARAHDAVAAALSRVLARFRVDARVIGFSSGPAISEEESPAGRQVK